MSQLRRSPSLLHQRSVSTPQAKDLVNLGEPLLAVIRLKKQRARDAECRAELEAAEEVCGPRVQL